MSILDLFRSNPEPAVERTEYQLYQQFGTRIPGKVNDREQRRRLVAGRAAFARIQAARDNRGRHVFETPHQRRGDTFLGRLMGAVVMAGSRMFNRKVGA